MTAHPRSALGGPLRVPSMLYAEDADGSLRGTGEYWCCACHRMMRRTADGLRCTREPAPFHGIIRHPSRVIYAR